MIPHPRRLVRRLGRILRPALVLALVAAQCVTAFGYPVVVKSGETLRRCGCKVRGPSAACCCGPRTCCDTSATQPIAAPEPPSCPKCKDKKPAPAPAAAPVAKSSTLKWLPSVTAQSCHGDNPHGLVAEFPSMPPTLPAAPTAEPRPVIRHLLVNDFPGSRLSIPPDPPPRRG